MTETTIVIALAFSITLNVFLAAMWLAAHIAADRWHASEQYMTQAYEHLRRNSHRRHPRTGRLLPLGE